MRNRRRFRSQVIAPTIAFGALVMSTQAMATDESQVTPYRDSVGLVAHLSNEAIEPFRYVGLRPSEHRPFRGYLDSIDEFRDVRACLVEAQGASHRPDLGEFDWEALDNSRDAAVCIFRIASSYRSLETLEAWFEAQGFRVQRRTYDGGLGNPAEYATVAVHASWSVKTKGPRFRAHVIDAWFTSYFFHSLSASAKFGADGMVKSVHVSRNSK